MRNIEKVNCIGVIGDVHTEDKLLKLAVEFLKQKNVEKIFCVGDIADGKGDINICCNLLEQEKITTVLGNHDRWLLTKTMRSLKDANSINDLCQQSLEFLESLPSTIDFLTCDGWGLLCHGLGSNDMAKVTPDDYGYAIEANFDLQKIIKDQNYKYVINGYTHKRMVRKFYNTTIINSGTLKQEHNPCLLMINFQEKMSIYLIF